MHEICELTGVEFVSVKETSVELIHQVRVGGGLTVIMVK